MNRPYDLEDRLIAFACCVIDVVDKVPIHPVGKHLSLQLVRSGTSPALNYAEAVGAESKADFIHKMGLVLKELRESRVCMCIIQQKNYVADTFMEPALDECSQLICIISKSIKTARNGRQ